MDKSLSTVDFAVDLARASPASWSADLSVWREQLVVALGKDRGELFGVRAGMFIDRKFDGLQPADFLEDDFARLQAQVIKILRPVSERKNRRVVYVRLRALDFMILPNKGKSILRVSGAVDAVFLYVLMVGLTLVPNVLIRECPKCHVLLRALGKRKFCSLACKNRAAMEKFLAREGREKRRLTRRAYYERNVPGGKPNRNRRRN